jgi:pyruvate kinase
MDLPGPKLRTGAIEHGPAVVRVRPERDEIGRVVKAARTWWTPEDAPEIPPERCAYTLRFPADWLRQLHAGDTVRFIDARGAHREFRIGGGGGASRWAESSKTAYLAPGMEFVLVRRGRRPAPARLGELPRQGQDILVKRDETLLLTNGSAPGRPAIRDAAGRVVEPARIGVTLAASFESVRPGEPVWFDDGKIGGVIDSVGSEGVAVRITQARPEGEKLGAGKGINIPQTMLRAPALGEDDLEALPFVAGNADIAGLSFVRSPEDVRQMREELARIGRPDLGLMLKIETRQGFENLPPILLEAMRSPAVGVMIARGDLAVECGFERLAEIQEEILWIAESAFVPWCGRHRCSKRWRVRDALRDQKLPTPRRESAPSA